MVAGGMIVPEVGTKAFSSLKDISRKVEHFGTLHRAPC